MTRAADIVEDDPRDGQLLVEVATAEGDRGGARGHALGIDHQDYGSAEQSCDMGRATSIVVRSITIEESHHALDNRDICAQSRACKDLLHHRVVAHPRI